MKKILLLIVVVVIAATMSQAQTQTDSSQAQTKTWQAGTANYQDYPTKDMRKLNTSEIPASLRTTLQGNEYTGWEHGSVYFNSSTNEYYYQQGSNSKTSLKNAPTDQKKNSTWYRFDSKGKLLGDKKPKS